MDQSGSLFSATAPLAARMRPISLDEVLGQESALAPGSPLRLLADPSGRSKSGTSIVLWGPPGTGKTTISKAVANSSGRRFVELSAVSAGVKELRDALDKAKLDQELYGVATILFLDEIHRFSKTQQDALLPAVESGQVILIAATTENPSFSIISPLLSRLLLVRLNPLTEEQIRNLLAKAVIDPRGLKSQVTLSEQARNRISALAGGDARRALTILETASARVLSREGAKENEIGIEDVNATFQAAMVRYDREGEAHYDTISAFIKSVRGSDADAAIHYLARMLEGGEDPRFIARRLIILASEDIGLADPTALPMAVSCFEAVNQIGMPEGRIVLAETTIYLALAPKSNSAYLAIEEALRDVRAGFLPEIPPFLRSSQLARGDSNDAYRYPHDDPRGVVKQEYTKEFRRYFEPKPMGYEQGLVPLWEKLRKIIRGEGA